MERREFLHSACAACIGAAMFGGSALLAGCGTASVYQAEIVEHSITVNPAAAAGAEMLVVRAEGLPYDILLVRQKDAPPSDQWHALLMECTHQHAPLTASSTGLHCSAHGSAFDLNGQVVRGPAARPLTTYPTSFSNNSIHILLPS